MRVFLLVLLIGSSLVSTSCTSDGTRNQMLRQGYDPSYSSGFADGESSGYVAAGHPYYRFTKDTKRFESDSQYRQGWNDGFQVAKGRYDAIGQSMR